MTHPLKWYPPWVILFCLMFIPSPTLAVLVNKPKIVSQSSFRVRIIITWEPEDGEQGDIEFNLNSEGGCPLDSVDLYSPIEDGRVVFSAYSRSRPGSCILSATKIPPDFEDEGGGSTTRKKGAKAAHTPNPTRNPGWTYEATHTPGPTRNVTKSSRGVIVGGSIGGFAVFILLCVFFYFHWKRRNFNKLRQIFKVHEGDVWTRIFPELRVPHFFRRLLLHGDPSTVHPMIYSGEYSQPGGKRERIEQARHRIAEAERQHEVLESTLLRDENNTRESSNNLDIEVNRLRSQMEELTRRIEEFEIIRRGDLEAQTLPDYYSRSARSTVEC
ncbi:hypothetical protein BDZ94DRAFT_1378539 [Collybia nuda]|uniref:Uncharacterized protein n=1 Tax=Collybia nuda TaxID=64659 RepID=A0A9P5Y2L2_9AGAR|nr:hypothetical protein BDZ94DRAFT_1378539 [Collybia nuda]